MGTMWLMLQKDGKVEKEDLRQVYDVRDSDGAEMPLSLSRTLMHKDYTQLLGVRANFTKRGPFSGAFVKIAEVDKAGTRALASAETVSLGEQSSLASNPSTGSMPPSL